MKCLVKYLISYNLKKKKKAKLNIRSTNVWDKLGRQRRDNRVEKAEQVLTFIINIAEVQDWSLEERSWNPP